MIMIKYSLLPTLANFVGSVLSHSLNSGYMAPLRSAQISLWGTSDTLVTLSEIARLPKISEV